MANMPIILKSDWDSQMVLAVAKAMPSEKARKWEVQAGHLFFKHRRASYHLECIKKCYLKIIGEMRSNPNAMQPEEGDNSGYAGPLAEVMLFHLDGFFEAERSAHDFVTTCLGGAKILKDPPKSLH